MIEADCKGIGGNTPFKSGFCDRLYPNLAPVGALPSKMASEAGSQPGSLESATVIVCTAPTEGGVTVPAGSISSSKA